MASGKHDTRSDTSRLWENMPTRRESPSDAQPGSPPSGVSMGVGASVAGRYHLERKLGAGGMGEVFLARDGWKNIPVAVKLLHGRMAGNLTVVNRFRREARVMRELASPHAAVIHDFGQADDGSLYLVMEYLEGETLGGLIEREAPLGATRVTQMALDLLDVLADAHRRGIIHRDIKPQNVFLARVSGQDKPVVKLLDFGIAKLQDQDATQITETGAIWGTPRYMSPEQARGMPVDRRSDLYSLGAMMYRALTGEHPFDGTNMAEISYALLHGTPLSPEKRRPDLGIPTDLGRIVMRAIEKDPNVRYSSAVEMAEDLRALLSEPVAAPAPEKGRAVRLVMRGWILVTVLLTLVAGLEYPMAARATFPGFAVESGLIVSSSVDPTWPGIERGIQPYDAVLAVDGAPVRRGRDVHRYVHRLPEGTPVTYTLRRDERTFEVTVPTSNLGWRALLKQYGSGFVVAVLFFLVGGVAGWKRPTDRAVQALVAFTSAVGMVLVWGADLDLIDSVSWIFPLGLCMAGGAELHLGLAFSNIGGAALRRPWLLVLPYVPALGLFVAWQVLGADAASCTQAGSSLMLTGFLALLGCFLYTRLRGKTLSLRQSARFMLWAVALSMLPAIALILVPISLGIQTSSLASLGWLATLAIAGFPAAFAYQIQRRQMFDVDLALREVARVACTLVVLGLVFAAAALSFGGMAWVFSGPGDLHLGLGVLAGVAAVVVSAEPLSVRIRRLLERRADVDGGSVLDEMAAATANVASDDEVVTLLFEALRRTFAPRSTRWLERGEGGFYWARVPDGPPSRAATGPRVSLEGDPSSATDEPSPRIPVEEMRRRLTRLGHFDAHVSLVLPLDGADGSAGATWAPASVVVIGARSDGKAYSSYDAALVAGLVRIAALRIHALGERARVEQRGLIERCFGPGRGDTVRSGMELVSDVPARGLATALVLRFSGLEAAADDLPPRRFKVLVDELSEAVAMAAISMDGTMHASRGDEMLFGFGALGVDRGAGELASIQAALLQIERTVDIARRHGAPSVRARVGVARGPLTVGMFGASFHTSCMILGSAIQEATELANRARDGELLVDEDVTRIVERNTETFRLETLPTERGATPARVSRRLTA